MAGVSVRLTVMSTSAACRTTFARPHCASVPHPERDRQYPPHPRRASRQHDTSLVPDRSSGKAHVSETILGFGPPAVNLRRGLAGAKLFEFETPRVFS